MYVLRFVTEGIMKFTQPRPNLSSQLPIFQSRAKSLPIFVKIDNSDEEAKR